MLPDFPFPHPTLGSRSIPICACMLKATVSKRLLNSACRGLEYMEVSRAFGIKLAMTLAYCCSYAGLLKGGVRDCFLPDWTTTCVYHQNGDSLVSVAV